MRYNVFRYTKFYHRLAGAELLLDLLNDPVAAGHLQVDVGKLGCVVAHGKWGALVLAVWGGPQKVAVG
jgi:hypothetical protein